MKIIFHDNSLCLYGTTVALFDYAYHCKNKFGIDAHILYNQHHNFNNDVVIESFKSEFTTVNSYSNFDDMQNKIDEVNPDAFFMVKSGQWDNVISKSCKNWTLAVSPRQNGIYGDKFAVASYWISQESGIKEVVPHMVDLPNHNDNFREEFGIPKNDIVFGRTGTWDEFASIPFVIPTVIEALQKRKDIWFVFQNTDVFYKHERIIYLPSSIDKYTKVKFINTCDALLHARFLGESFGLVCAEFSSKNKPVITWNESQGRNHIFVLGDKGIYYNNSEDLMKIILSFVPNDSIDWNCYRDYYPEPVMEKFYDVYFK